MIVRTDYAIESIRALAVRCERLGARPGLWLKGRGGLALGSGVRVECDDVIRSERGTRENREHSAMDAHDLINIEPNPRVAEFQPGDTVKVSARVTEGERQRTQVFQGVVIRKRGRGPGATFTVRRVAHDVGVERTFPLHSPAVEAVEVTRQGAVRRARLYYLRGLSGRAARIKERRRG